MMAKNYHLFRLDVTCKNGGEIAHREQGYKNYEIEGGHVAGVVTDAKKAVRTDLLPHYEEVICMIREHKPNSEQADPQGYAPWKWFTLQRSDEPASEARATP